jgi:hypothetical protein
MLCPKKKNSKPKFEIYPSIKKTTDKSINLDCAAGYFLSL